MNSSSHFLLIPLTFPSADTELRDSPLGRGGVQHRSVAQKQREEPQHGRPAAWSSAGLFGYNRGREQQLHQRCSGWQLLQTGCLHRHPSPSARHHCRLLEAGVWLRLHRCGHAEPTQPVQLCLGKSGSKGRVVVLLLFFFQTFEFTRTKGQFSFSLDVVCTPPPPHLSVSVSVLRISSFMPFCCALIPDHIDFGAWIDNSLPRIFFSFLLTSFISWEKVWKHLQSHLSGSFWTFLFGFLNTTGAFFIYINYWTSDLISTLGNKEEITGK